MDRTGFPRKWKFFYFFNKVNFVIVIAEINNGSRRCAPQSQTVEKAFESTKGRPHGKEYSVERSNSVYADAVNLKRRVGLFSGVALIVGFVKTN